MMAKIKNLANAMVEKVIDEIITIQRASIIIASSGLDVKLNIYKRHVDKYTLMKIAEKFKVQIQPECIIAQTPPYVLISNNSCNIVVQLEIKK